MKNKDVKCPKCKKGNLKYFVCDNCRTRYNEYELADLFGLDYTEIGAHILGKGLEKYE